MGCGVASEEHSGFLGINIGVNPLGPGVESFPIGIMDIQLPINMIALLIIIFPVAHFRILNKTTYSK
jgi:hypothetical protein